MIEIANKKIFTKNFFILGGLVLVGLALRLMLDKTMGYFWFDEAFSVHFSSMDFSNMTRYIVFDNHPLFFPAVLNGWIKLFGNQEFVVRLLSVAFGLLSIITIYFLGREMVNKKTGLIAAFLLTITPYSLYYTTEARMYGMLLFFILLSTLFYWKILKQPTVLNSVIFSLSTFCLLHTHLLAVIIVFLFNIFYFINYFYYKNKKLKIISWFYIQFLLFISYAWWLAIFIYLRIKYIFPLLDEKNIWFLKTYFLNNNFFNLIVKGVIFNNYVDYYLEPLVNSFILFIFLAFLSIRFIKHNEFRIKIETSPEKIFLLIVFLVITLMGFVFQKPLLRYYVLCLPAIYLLLSAGLAKLGRRALLVIIFCFVLVVITSYQKNFLLIGNNKELIQYLESATQTDSKTKIMNHIFDYQIILDKYYTGRAEVEGFYPWDDMPDKNYRYIIKNYQRGLVNEENVNRLAESAKGYEKIIFIFTTNYEEENNLIMDWFESHDYQITSAESIDSKRVITFVLND